MRGFQLKVQQLGAHVQRLSATHFMVIFPHTCIHIHDNSMVCACSGHIRARTDCHTSHTQTTPHKYGLTGAMEARVNAMQLDRPNIHLPSAMQ